MLASSPIELMSFSVFKLLKQMISYDSKPDILCLYKIFDKQTEKFSVLL